MVVRTPKSCFDEKQRQEKIFNRHWDSYFNRYYFIFEAGLDLDLMGVDRVFVNRKTGIPTTIEYKNDIMAGKTGRVFVESKANVEFNTDGWIFTCKAMKLLIAVPTVGQVYICDTARMRAEFPKWLEKFGTRKAFNGRYESEGVCLPLSVLVTVADAFITIGKPDGFT